MLPLHSKSSKNCHIGHAINTFLKGQAHDVTISTCRLPACPHYLKNSQLHNAGMWASLIQTRSTIRKIKPKIDTFIKEPSNKRVGK